MLQVTVPRFTDLFSLSAGKFLLVLSTVVCRAERHGQRTNLLPSVEFVTAEFETADLCPTLERQCNFH